MRTGQIQDVESGRIVTRWQGGELATTPMLMTVSRSSSGQAFPVTHLHLAPETTSDQLEFILVEQTRIRDGRLNEKASTLPSSAINESEDQLRLLKLVRVPTALSAAHN